jgi:hypothetical protein
MDAAEQPLEEYQTLISIEDGTATTDALIASGAPLPSPGVQSSALTLADSPLERGWGTAVMEEMIGFSSATLHSMLSDAGGAADARARVMHAQKRLGEFAGVAEVLVAAPPASSVTITALKPVRATAERMRSPVPFAPSAYTHTCPRSDTAPSLCLNAAGGVVLCMCSWRWTGARRTRFSPGLNAGFVLLELACSCTYDT